MPKMPPITVGTIRIAPLRRDLLSDHGDVQAEEAGEQIPIAIELLGVTPNTVSSRIQELARLGIRALEEAI